MSSYKLRGGVDEFETFLADTFEQQGGDFNTNHLVSASFNTTGNLNAHSTWLVEICSVALVSDQALLYVWFQFHQFKF